MDYIATTDLRVENTLLIPGDRVDSDRLINLWGERTFDLLKEHEQVLPLTRERFQMVVVRRPAGAPWPPAGFTQAYLEQAGVIDPEAAPESTAPPEMLSHIELTDAKVKVGPFYYQPRKSGRFTYYDVADAEGRLLRNSAFRLEEKAREFLEELFTNPATAGTPGPEQGADDDDGELQA